MMTAERTYDTYAAAPHHLAVPYMQMHAAYVNAVTKTKQATEKTCAEEATIAELRSKAQEYSRCVSHQSLLGMCVLDKQAVHG
jgi:hypothetical protein